MLIAALAALLGVATWSFSEYWIHRRIFHTPRGKTVFNREHLAHHARTSYFAPTLSKVMVALGVTAVLSPVAIVVAGLPTGIAYVVGFVAGYTIYEIIHRRTHTHAPRGPYSRWARKHHMHHHFHSPRMNHGVTSPVWDIVFRTYERTEVVTVPKRQVMDWLLDPLTGDVAERYVRDYRLGRGRLARRRGSVGNSSAATA